MDILFGLLAWLFLAFANGANGNFKGVATLLGSGTTHYRRALVWATVTMALGSLLALTWAKGLLVTFSSKGLVPDGVVFLKSFSVAVALAAGLTVLLATRLGFPLSTTHVSCGSLFGLGVATKQIQWKTLRSIVLSWIVTLPVAALLGMLAFFLLERGMS